MLPKKELTLSSSDDFVTAEKDIIAAPEQYYDPSTESKWTRLGISLNSFRRAPAPIVSNNTAVAVDVEQLGDDAPRLQHRIKARHLQLMSIGGNIGTGLFIATGGGLRVAGPGGMLVAWGLVGLTMINLTQALGELAILYPLSGGYYALTNRFVDRSCGFAMGWGVVLQWLIVLPVEITAASMAVSFWDTGVSKAAWLFIFWLIIIVLNIFGSLGYAEEEFCSSLLKLVVVTTFIIAALVFDMGGGPSNGMYSDFVGGSMWADLGSFSHGFKGVCAAMVSAAFSYSGTELVGLAACETANPCKTMPSVVKKTFMRIIVIYLASMAMIGLLVPYTDPRLMGASGRPTSPFVIVVQNAGVPALAHLINATICVSVLSIGMSAVFAGSRTLCALAEQGSAPRFLTYVDRSGRPLWATVVALSCGAMSFLTLTPEGNRVFDWLMAADALTTLFTWAGICLCHVRFRSAWRAQGHSLDELPFRALGGAYGSMLGIVICVGTLAAQLYVAIDPVDGEPSVKGFFKAYIGVLLNLSLWILGYAWLRGRPFKAHEIDLDTGRKSWLSVEEIRAQREARESSPAIIRFFKSIF